MTDHKESNPSLKDRLRRFLNLHQNQSTTLPTGDETNEINMIGSYLHEVSASFPIESRMETLSALEAILTTKQVDCEVIENVWTNTCDLLEAKVSPVTRHLYFDFLQRLISYQYRNFKKLTTLVYHKLSSMNYHHPQDILRMFLIIDGLSDHGKHLEFFDENISFCLVFWMDVVGNNTVYLSFLLNVVKFNSSHLDETTIEGVVHHLCAHSLSTSHIVLESLLKVLDAIICYNSLPQGCLHSVVITLCQTLNQKSLCDTSWKIMRNLLGTHLGHSCVQTMCKLLQNIQAAQDALVLRSAVFFLGMGLWGSKCVTTLMHKPQSVLPYFEHSLKMQNSVIGFEVSLTCQRLVKKFGHDLHPLAWESILRIIDSILSMSTTNIKKEQYHALQENTHELISLIEKLYEIQTFDGSAEELFSITDKYCHQRPRDSLLLLLTYKAQSINPAKKGWLSNLSRLMEKFYIPASKMKVEVRIKALELFANATNLNFDMYEKDFIDLLTILGFSNLPSDPSVPVQEKAIDLVSNLALRSKSNQCGSLLQCLKPFVHLSSVPPSFVSEFTQGATNTCASKAVKELVNVFTKKFYTSHANYCKDVYEMVIDFLTTYYQSQVYFPKYLCEARIEALRLLFGLRSNSQFQLRLAHDKHYSPAITCKEGSDISKSYPSVVLSVDQAIICFIQCFEKEKHWEVLSLALSSLCEYLEDKCLLLSAALTLLRTLVEVIGNLVTSATREHGLIGTPADFKREDLQSAALCVLAIISSYHEHIDISRQRQMIRCLETGFATKCAKQCISATTLCMVEMNSDAFLRVLPSILLHLSQMSATVHLATVVLELLSTLSQLPSLYRNFVEDQYMSVFAIALEHAAPEKFSLYVVSLAHYVIGMWFVKCRLSFRPDFVKFITRKLQNVNRNCAEDALQHDLIESCIDVMARYTFSNSMSAISCLNKNRKMISGKSSTWLLGNRLITITTDRRGSKSRPTSNIETGDVASAQPYLERRLSVEAPGKLQSTNVTYVRTKSRHKSGGAVLFGRNHVPLGDDVAPLVSCRNSPAEQTVCFTEMNASRAEICIRRPSGNTMFVLDSQQINLVQISDQNKVSQPKIKKISFNDETANGDFGGIRNKADIENSIKPITRHRSHTVSTRQDYAHDSALQAAVRARQQRTKTNTCDLFEDSKHGMVDGLKSNSNEESSLTPEFVFLQLFQSSIASNPHERAMLLPKTPAVERAVQVLDMIPPYDTWSTGVVYVRPGQKSDAHSILSNEHGSTRYQNFLSSLGQLVALRDADSSRTYLGGLDQSEGEDGLFTYVWQENIMQMVFHITTFMPNRGTDMSHKQRHIGNDYVIVVYDDNEKGHYVPRNVVKGQFLSVEIIVNPLKGGFNCVRLIYHKPDVQKILEITEKRIVSDQRLGLLVKQMALHANMAAAAHRYKEKAGESVSKPFSRLKQIKRLRSRVQHEVMSDEVSKSRSSNPGSQLMYGLEEFSEYI